MRKACELTAIAALLALAIAIGWSLLIVLTGGGLTAIIVIRAAREIPRSWAVFLPVAAYVTGMRSRATTGGIRLDRYAAVSAGLLAAAAFVTIQVVAPRSLAAGLTPAEVGLASPVEAMDMSELHRFHSTYPVVAPTGFNNARLIASRFDWEWAYRLALPPLVFVALLLGVLVAAHPDLARWTGAWRAALSMLLLLHLLGTTVAGQELSEQVGLPGAIPAFMLVFLPAAVLLALLRPRARTG